MEKPVLLNHEGEALDTNETVYCRILHLSDLHLSLNSSNNEFDSFCFGTTHSGPIGESVTGVDNILKQYGLRGYLNKNPVDCIVITGDFTNRGDFSEDNIKYIKNCIKNLYEICAKAGAWKYNGVQWNEKLPMNRLFYCAGNHDLLRDAVCYDPKTGKYIARQNVVRELARQQDAPGRNGYLPSHDAAKFSLLTASAFRPFFEMLESLRRGSEEKQEVNNFEGTVFCLKAREDSKGPDICFAAINTALLAGNVDSVDPNTIQTSWLKMQASVDVQEKCQAAKDYYDLLQMQAGRVINDGGKLCMPSEKALDILTGEIRGSSSYIGIMLGHHNYSLLCENAKKAFNGFVKKCEIGLYLCGHTHRPDNNGIAKSELYSKDKNLQIRVSSGAFFDKTDYYSSLGFSIHTIFRTSEDCYFCQSENIAYFRLPEIWMNINVDSPNTQNRFKMDVSKVELPTVSTSNTPQSGDGTEGSEYTEDKNPLITSDTDNRKEIPKNQTNIPETEPSAHTTLSTPLSEDGMGNTEHIVDENPLMNTDCKADHIVDNDEAIHDAEKNLKNMGQKENQDGRGVEEVDKKKRISDEIPDQLLSFKYSNPKLPPDMLTPSGSWRKI